MTDPVGSYQWWCASPTWGARGFVDTVLRMLELEAISRAKARELLACRLVDQEDDPIP